MSEFKVGDCVRLINGYTPDMTISEINETAQEATCYWWDKQATKKMVSQTLPFSVLKKCPDKITLEDIQNIIGVRR